VQQEWQLPSLHGKMQQGSQPEMPGEAWPQRLASCSGLYQEEYTELWESISQMEQKFREVVLLYYFEGFKTREIARLLNIQEGTVKSRLSRARDKLKKDLKI
jgi:DNA-directed RNA polymerase specialized sigma24 family protein